MVEGQDGQVPKISTSNDSGGFALLREGLWHVVVVVVLRLVVVRLRLVTRWWRMRRLWRVVYVYVDAYVDV